MREIISFTIEKSLREIIDELRGDIPRSKYIHKILEDKLRKYIVKEDYLDKVFDDIISRISNESSNGVNTNVKN